MNLGFPEMLFIFLLALLIFGPKKLPEIGRQVGKALAEFKRASNEFKWQIEAEVRQLEAEAASVKTEAAKVKQDLPRLEPPLGSILNTNATPRAVAAASDSQPAAAETPAGENPTQAKTADA